jgi:TRAP-type transport system small permease protein
MLHKLIGQCCRLFAFMMVLSLALMVVMVFGNVALRYAFNTGITVSEELSRWLFVWMTFIGALIALRSRAHLGTHSFVSRLPLAGKKICFGISHLLMLFVCWLMVQGAWEQTKINLGTTSAVMEASMAYLYVSGVVFAVLAVLIILHDFWKLVSGQLSDAELVGVTESEEMSHDGQLHREPASAARK